MDEQVDTAMTDTSKGASRTMPPVPTRPAIAIDLPLRENVRADWRVGGLGIDRLTLWAKSAPVGSLELVNRHPRWLQITDFNVLPEFRGQALGHLMLALTMDRAFTMRKASIRLSVQDSGTGALRRWYLNYGFYPVGVDRSGRAIVEIPAIRK